MNDDDATSNDPNTAARTTTTLAQAYQRDGFVGPIDVLTPAEAQQALVELETWAAATFPGGGHVVEGDARFKPHLYLPFCSALAHHETIIHAVQQVLQTNDIILWSSDFNIKPAKSAGHYAPHQDAAYAGLDPPDKVVTVWLALSANVTAREGCLSFWQGSHKLGGILPHQEEQNADSNNMLSRGQRVIVDNDKSNQHVTPVVTVPLTGGQATLHNFLTIHESGPNQSNQSRIGLAMRYADAATVRQVGRVRESVTVVTGNLPHDGCFDVEPILPSHNPTADDIDRGKRAHAMAMQRERQNYFTGALQQYKAYK